MDWAGPPKSGLCSVTLLVMGGGGASGAAGMKEAQKDRSFLPGQRVGLSDANRCYIFIFASPRRYISGH